MTVIPVGRTGRRGAAALAEAAGAGALGGVIALGAALIAGPALSAPAGPTAQPGEAPRQNRAPPPPPAAPSNRVSGITVTLSRETPHVVSTFPAQGASVAPGVLVLRVSFDEPMFGDSWSYVTSAAGDYPDCAAAPRRLDDRKSFALICRTTGKHAYALWINRAPYANFLSLARKPATPYLLRFTTSDDDPVRTLKEAMEVDPGLPAGSNPAEAEGKRRPGESVDIDAASTPAAPPAAAKPSAPS